ncbi:MAG TPA: CheR family methyltransferase [Terracidiphilus sp.]
MNYPGSGIERFGEKIEAEFGLVFDESRKEQVQQVLQARSSELHLDPEEYLRFVGSAPGEWHAIAALLTVPESYFFRHIDHLRAFREIALAERTAAHPNDRTQRICCIGCANGEEPYTLSMLLREQFETQRDWQFRIRACDINPEALRRARRGVYTNWALRATPPVYRERYFTAVANRFRVADEIREAVHFEHCNALSLYRPEHAESLDVVFFRNVLIYFSPEAIRAAVNAVAHLLAPGGFLFLGPAETLRGVSDDFKLCHTHETFYYQRKQTIGELIPFSPVRTGTPRRSVPPPALENREFNGAHGKHPLSAGAMNDGLADSQGAEWVDEIGRSAERIKGLDADRRHRPAAAHIRPGAAPRNEMISAPRQLATVDDVQRVMTLFRAELYDKFLDEMKVISPEAADDPDLQLLRSLVHLNRHEIGEAEASCRALIARDSMNASGHYVLALCREHAHDLAGAADHDRIAIYLDSAFAMPHMHLALISRRRGDHHTARREFEQAILLLARESESRLLMFGGGFNREALRKLCRRELQAIGSA